MSRALIILIYACISFQALASEINRMEKIYNFYQLTENIGTAGQPTIEQFTDIAREKYSAVINLAMHDSDNAIPEEGNIVRSLGITYIHIPVPWDAPSIDHIKEFFKVMDELENKKIFVHCAANYRASAFMHQYLTLRKEMTSNKATSPILREWLPEMDNNWKKIMQLGDDDFDYNQH